DLVASLVDPGQVGVARRRGRCGSRLWCGAGRRRASPTPHQGLASRSAEQQQTGAARNGERGGASADPQHPAPADIGALARVHTHWTGRRQWRQVECLAQLVYPDRLRLVRSVNQRAGVVEGLRGVTRIENQVHEGALSTATEALVIGLEAEKR